MAYFHHSKLNVAETNILKVFES